MDNKHVLGINKGTPLYTGPKASDPKNTKVFVLPPELLKGLLLDHKLPKLSQINKNESPTVVDQAKNAQSFAKNNSNDVKIQKLTFNIGDINKTVVSTKQIDKKLNAKSQLQNATLERSTENEKKLYLEKEEANKLNNESHTKILNRNTRRGRKKLDRDKELKKSKTIDKITNDFSNEKEFQVLKVNKNNPIKRVYSRKPKIIEDKIIKNFVMNDIHIRCDNVYNKKILKSTNSSEYSSDSCLEGKDQENTVGNTNKIKTSKCRELTNPVEFLSNKESLNSYNIDSEHKVEEIVINAVNPNTINITNDEVVFDTNLQMKSSDVMEEHETKNLISSPEQNNQIKIESIVDQEEGEVTEEIIIIEETIEEIEEYDDCDTDLNAGTLNKDLLNDVLHLINNETAELTINDKHDNEAITVLNSNKNESVTNSSLVIKESFEVIKPINDKRKMKDQLNKDEISNVDVLSKTVENEVHKHCDLFPSEEACIITPTNKSNDANKVETKLIDNTVAVIENNISSKTSISENVSKGELLNIDEQHFSKTFQIENYEKKEIPISTSESVKCNSEIESTENVGVTTSVNEKNHSTRRSTRLSKNRYKPVVNNYKRKQKNCELKEYPRKVNDSLNIENSESAANSVISQIKDPIHEKEHESEAICERDILKINQLNFNKKNETIITSDSIDSNIHEEKLISTKVYPASGRNKKISEEIFNTKKILIEKDNKSESTTSVKERAFKENNTNMAINEETPIISEDNKREISKIETELAEKTLVNISNLTTKSLKNIVKGNLLNSFDQEKNAVIEAHNYIYNHNYNNEISNNPDIPVTNDELTNISNNDVVEMQTDEVKENEVSYFPVNSGILSVESHNVTVIEEISHNTLMDISQKSIKINIDIIDKNLKSEVSNENVEEILDNGDGHCKLNEKIPKIVTEFQKQEISKKINELNTENANISTMVEEMENIDSKSDFSDTFDNQTYGAADFQSDSSEIEDGPFLGFPVNNDLANTYIEKKISSADLSEQNNMLSDKIYNDAETEELNDHTSMESLKESKIEEILNDTIVSLNSNINSTNVENIKFEKDWPVNKPVSNLVSKDINRETTKLKTELTNKSLATVSKTLKDIETVNNKSDFLVTYNQEISDTVESQCITEKVTYNPDVSIVCYGEVANINTDISNNILTDEVNKNPVDDIPIKNGTLIESYNNTVTKEVNIKEILNDTTANYTKSNLSRTSIDVIQNDKGSGTKKENTCEKSDEICSVNEEITRVVSEFEKLDQGTRVLESEESINEDKADAALDNPVFNSELTEVNYSGTNHQEPSHQNLLETSFKNIKTNDIATDVASNNQIPESSDSKVVEILETEVHENSSKASVIDADSHQENKTAPVSKKKGRRARPPKAVKKQESNSKTLENESDLNSSASNQINEVPEPQKRTCSRRSSCLKGSVIETSNNSIEPKVQKRKRARSSNSTLLKEDSNVKSSENSENDFNINTTNSEVNGAQRRSRRLYPVKSTTETKLKVSDSKEVPARKKSACPKLKTSESKVVENKLDESPNIESRNLNEEADSDVINLLKMKNSNEDNSDKQQNVEATERVEDKIEEQIPIPNVMQKKRGRPPKSATLKATVTPDAVPNSISKLCNEKLTELSDIQAVDEDSVYLGKRKRRSRFDISSEIVTQDDLQVETPNIAPSSKKRGGSLLISSGGQLPILTKMVRNDRKRRRSSRFAKSLESNSQDEDTKLETTKNDSDHENAISGKSDNNDEIRRGRSPKKRKKRGRPSGRSAVKHDNDYEPHHSQVQRSPAKQTNKRKSKKSNETQEKESIVCGRCGKSLKKNQWTNHNMSIHNNLGWIEGTVKPDFDNDEKLVFRILARLLKSRKKLICEKCNAAQRSVPGHLSHVMFCGKTEDEMKALMVTCPGCNVVMKPSSLEYHERLHQRQAEENPKVIIEASVEPTDSGMKTKRKAAEKAASKISEIVTLTKTDDGSGPPDKKMKLNDLKKFIQKPKLTKRIPSILVNKWQKNIDSGEAAACCQVGCKLSFKTLDEIKEHYSTCNFTPQENFVCRICKYQSKSKDEIIQHTLESHNIEKEDEKAYVSDTDYSSESECEDTFVKISIERTQRSTKKLSFAERNDPLNKKFRFLFKDGVSYTKYSKTFLTAFQWTLEFEEKNYSFHFFDDYSPNTFELLKMEESKKYFPELTESMPMTSSKKDRNAEWKTWKIFEGQCFDDFPTFFSGGPVWALAWLPIPSFLCFTSDITQFVAISSHPTMDKEYSVGEIYAGKNIIQIWNMGDLNNNANNMSDPKLAYAIAHDGGTVWCLEWCPSGCYDHEDLPGFVKKESELRRMGLLAAACSDGSIRVYSLIFPEDLPTLRTNNDEKTDECLVYKTDPVLMLVVNRKMFDNKQQNWQVMKLSWTKERGHNFIVAGLSNGYVAIWDLTTNSPMLKCKRENTIFLNPFKHFLAHLHAVTMVYLVPQDNKRYLVTTSLDRHYKFWDLEDTSNPRNDLKKTYVTDASWFNHWNCVLLAGDDALSMKLNHLYSRPVRELTYRYFNVVPSNSATFSVDTSDFGNSVANGTLAGEVLAIFPQQMMYISDMKQSIPRKRLFSIVSSVEVVDFQETKNKELANGKSDQEEYKYMPSTYKDSKDRFGLKFCDKLNQFRNGYAKISGINPKKTLTCEMMQTVPVEQYPFMSVNRVSWNPNSWSFLWLAVGYQNGFVRFIPFKYMNSTKEWNAMLTDHIKKLKNRRHTMDVDR